MDNSATDEDAVALLRAHVAAEVAKATGDLRADKERLDWLDSRDGAFERISHEDHRHYWGPGMLRRSIDAACAQQKDTP